LLNAVANRSSSRNLRTFFLNTRRWVMTTRYCNPKCWSSGTCFRNMVGFISFSKSFYFEEALWWRGLGIA
jgi:hypothetical protein